ncbi:MAG: glycosyltransferase [Patescibacteria group bacterium]
MISIVIPTLNEEAAIDRTVRGIKNGLQLPYEIIVSDGNSADKTREYARKAGARVVAYEGVGRQSIAEGRNAGARASTGAYILFLDADCSVADPDAFFNRALSRFGHDSELTALTGYVRVSPENEHLSDKLVMGMVNTYFRILNNIVGVGASTGEFQFMRREAFYAVGGFQNVSSEDMNMFHRLAKKGKTRFDPELVVYHTGRRIRKIGWTRLLFQWMRSWFSMVFTGKTPSTPWPVVR